MKLRTFLLSSLLLMLFLPPLVCRAENDLFSDSDISALIPEEVKGSLDRYDRDSLPLGGAEGFFREVMEQTASLLPSLGVSFSSLFAFLLLSGISAALRREITSPSLSRLQSLFSSVCLTALLCGSVDRLLVNVLARLENLTVFVNSLLPYMTLLSLSGGNAVSAASQNAGVLLALSLTETLSIHALSPLIKICLTLVIADSFSPDVDLSPLLSLIKKTYSVLLTSSMSLLSIVLLFQSSLSLAADNAAARGVKFAGSFVPIVGSSLGDAVRTVLSGLSVVKNSLGFFGLAVVFLLILPSVLELTLQKLALSAAKSAAEMLNMKEESTTLARFGDILSLMLAAAVSASVIFIIAFALFVTMTYTAV